MSFMSNGIKRRAAYKYVCTKCGKRRIAYKFERARDRICFKCQKLENNPNQGELFSGDKEHNGTGVNAHTKELNLHGM